MLDVVSTVVVEDCI
jgi:hypothetical protein